MTGRKTAVIFGGDVSDVNDTIDRIRGLFSRVVVASRFADPVNTPTGVSIERVFLTDDTDMSPDDISSAYMADRLFDLAMGPRAQGTH